VFLILITESRFCEHRDIPRAISVTLVPEIFTACSQGRGRPFASDAASEAGARRLVPGAHRHGSQKQRNPLRRLFDDNQAGDIQRGYVEPIAAAYPFACFSKKGLKCLLLHATRKEKSPAKTR
jgi:hypothetical protein